MSGGNPDIKTFENRIICGDATETVKKLPAESVHCILSDIPYGIGAEDWDVLHANTNSAYLGMSPAQKKAGKVFKSRGKPLNGWSEADKQIPKEYYEWCMSWASAWYNVVKPGGSVFIFAGRRLAHRCASAMEDAGFTFKDSLAWMRQKAPHRAQRLSVVYGKRGDKKNEQDWQGWRVGNLRPRYEPIMWFTKPYKTGGTIADNVLAHGVGAYNQDGFIAMNGAPENVLSLGFTPGETGKHPTQKPIKLMQALLELSTKPGQLVLDPFVGSGTTAIAAKSMERKYIGVDISEEYCKLAEQRLNNTDVAMKFDI